MTLRPMHVKVLHNTMCSSHHKRDFVAKLPAQNYFLMRSPRLLRLKSLRFKTSNQNGKRYGDFYIGNQKEQVRLLKCVQTV